VIHELPLERRTLHGHFSRDLEPVLTVDSGDSIVFSTLDAGWHLELADEPPSPRFEPRDETLDAGHALVGRLPFAVRAPAGPSRSPSTSSAWERARSSTCPSRSTARCSRPAMATRARATARCRRSRRRDALARASLLVDLRITQIVNGVKGVHALLRDDAIR